MATNRTNAALSDRLDAKIAKYKKAINKLNEACVDAASEIIELKRKLAGLRGEIKARKRFSGVEPRADMVCVWCKEIKETALEEIWNSGNLQGRLTRLCNDCSACCAGP